MFNSSILDMIIGMVVIFLQLSLVVTAVDGWLAHSLQKRSGELEKGISVLLAPQLVNKFYEHARPSKRARRVGKNSRKTTNSLLTLRTGEAANRKGRIVCLLQV